MSRIVNLKTIRFNIFNVYDSWYNSWFEDIKYSHTLHEDLMLKNYLMGIFYKLKVPTNYFFLKRSINGSVFIYTDLFFMKHYKKSLFKSLFKEQLYYFSYLLKFYSIYKTYLFSYYFKNDDFNVDLFFSNKKIRQITFIGTNIFNKSKSIYSSNFNNNISNMKFLNDLFFIDDSNLNKRSGLFLFYNKSFIFFIQKYIESFFSSFFLEKDNSAVSIINYNHLYTNYLNKLVICLFYLRQSCSIHLIKLIFDYQMLLRLNSGIVENKIASRYNNYFYYLVTKNNYTLNKINIEGTFHVVRHFSIFYLFVFYLFNFNLVLVNSFMRNINLILFIKKSNISSTNIGILQFFTNIFDVSKSFSIIKYLKLKFYRMSYIYNEGNYKKKLVKRVLNQLLYKTLISDFFYKIENTVSFYLKKKVYLSFNLFYLDMDNYPSITNAKIITDYIVYLIHNQVNIRSIFKKVHAWQLENNEHRNYLDNLYFQFQSEGKLIEHLNQLSFKRYPIIGIRVECSGTAKKGTRKQKIFYGDWVKEFDSGIKSPNNTFSADLDYYQSFAIVKSSTLGVKVWVFFKTHLYNTNNVFVSLVSY